MNKLFIAVLATLCLTGCSVEAEPAVDSNMYVVAGHYYTSGEVITEDGNIWGYSHDVSGYDGEPVYVLFDNAGTPDYIYDDEIVGIVSR